MSAYPLEDRDSMSFRELVAWAWRETPPVHTNGRHVLLLAAVGVARWLAVAGFLCIVVSLALLFSGLWYASLKSP